MKKIISFLLAIVFIFTLCACGNKNTSSDTDRAPAQTATFVKPENYVAVLVVSINPQFKLYIDETNKVLAVEPINDDAKSFSKSIDFENKTVESVVGDIVEKANEKGFIKENVTVNFEITEQKEGFDNSNILTKVISAVNQKATELKIEIKTEIKESDKSQTTETNSENTQTDKNSKPTTTIPTENKPTHIHSYSAATCTTPQKCSCGETKGNALGHKWQDATCKAPKTCSTCKATEGNIGAHKYTGGKCIYCGDKQKINPKEGIKKDGYYYLCLKDNFGNESLGVYQFRDSAIFLIDIYIDNEDDKISEKTITYHGKTYFHYDEGDGFTQKYTSTDTEIILKEDNLEIRMIVNYQYDLEIVYSTDEDISVGMVFDLVE